MLRKKEHFLLHNSYYLYFEPVPTLNLQRLSKTILL
jgi:hypothetical protein